MNISGWMIYLITIADNLSCAFCIVTIIVGIVGAICAIIRAVGADNLDDGEKKAFNKCIKTCIFIFSFSLLGTVLVPSGKALAAIYIIPKIANNETLKDEAGEIYKFAKDWLKSTLEDKKTEVEKTVGK